MSVAEAKFDPAIVNVRTKISALWTSMLFVFAYVDLFSLYRPDIPADLEAAEVGGFTINQSSSITHGPGQSRHPLTFNDQF